MLKLIAAAALAAVAVPAAAYVSISASGDTTDTPFYQSTQGFNLTSTAGVTLNIASLNSDDLVVVSVNGTPIVGEGIFGPGNGYVYYSATGPSTPFYFAYGGGAVNASFAAPFVVGGNTVTITVNNNNAGINSGNGPLTGGPGFFDVEGNVGQVPEPAMWGLMVAGFGLVGAAARGRRGAVAA